MGSKYNSSGRKVTFRIEGLPELDRALQALPKNLTRKLIRPIVKEEAKVVLARAKQEAPVGKSRSRRGRSRKVGVAKSSPAWRKGRPGALRRGIKIKARKRTRKPIIAYNINVRDSKKKDSPWYGAPVEYGHDNVRGGTKGKGGRVVGHVKANPFMKRAYRAVKSRVADELKTKVARVILAEAARLGQGGGRS